jgi:hypothetical protein
MFPTFLYMTYASYPSSYVEIGRTYAALRQSGASSSRAGLELGLSAGEQHQLEALFRVRRPGLGCDAVRPRFARCAQHVAAVRHAGGYPVLCR